MTQTLLNRNVLFNIVGGFSTMLIGIALPPLLSRLLAAEDFASWMFALQIASYLSVLNFGLQMVLAQAVAANEAVGKIQDRNAVVSTAFWFVFSLSLIGWIMMTVAINNFEMISSELSAGQDANLRQSIVLIASSFIFWLPVSMLLSVFIGQQRNEWYAIAMLGSRLLILASVITFALATRDIVSMAYAWLYATLAASLGIVALWYKNVRQARLSPMLVTLGKVQSLVKGGATLTFWNIVVLLVTGFQVFLVGRFEFSVVAIFSGALSVAALLVGLSAAVTATLVPHVVHHLHSTRGSLPFADLERVALLGNLITFGGSTVLLLGGWWFVRIWLGTEYADAGMIVIALVPVSQAIRNSLSAYSMVTIALGLQHKLLIGPLFEGLLAVGLGIWLAPTYGVYGVLWAMLISPFGNIIFTILTNPIGKMYPSFNRGGFMFRSALVPALPLFPAILILAITDGSEHSTPEMLLISLVFLGIYMLWIAHVFAHKESARP